jgi:hypothetical protein
MAKYIFTFKFEDFNAKNSKFVYYKENMNYFLLISDKSKSERSTSKSQDPKN